MTLGKGIPSPYIEPCAASSLHVTRKEPKKKTNKRAKKVQGKGQVSSWGSGKRAGEKKAFAAFLGPALAGAGAGLALGAAAVAGPTAVVPLALALPGGAVGVGGVAGEAVAAGLEAAEGEERLRE